MPVNTLQTHVRRVRYSRSDVISATVSTIFQEYFKSTERTVFWNDEQKANIDPFLTLPQGSFWQADWDMKVRIVFRSRVFFSSSSVAYVSELNSAQNHATTRGIATMSQFRHQGCYRPRLGRYSQ